MSNELHGPLVLDAETFIASASGGRQLPPIYEVLLVSGVGTLTWRVLYNGHIVSWQHLSGSGEVNLGRGATGSISLLPTGVYVNRFLDCVVSRVPAFLWVPIFADELITCAFQGTAFLALYVTQEV